MPKVRDVDEWIKLINDYAAKVPTLEKALLDLTLRVSQLEAVNRALENALYAANGGARLAFLGRPSKSGRSGFDTTSVVAARGASRKRGAKSRR